jgi:hypothetical protein
VGRTIRFEPSDRSSTTSRSAMRPWRRACTARAGALLGKTNVTPLLRTAPTDN